MTNTVNVFKFQTLYYILFGLKLAFYAIDSSILSGMANSEDPNQTAPLGSGSALFACAILSEALVYKILGHLP